MPNEQRKQKSDSPQHSRAFQQFIDQAESLIVADTWSNSRRRHYWCKSTDDEIAEEASPKMREEEKDEVPRYFLKVAHEMGEEMAQAGYIIPGNDPKKPN